MARVLPFPESAAEAQTPLTVAGAIPRFLAQYADHSPNTRASFAADLKRFAEACGTRPVAKVTREEVRAYLAGLRRRGGGWVSACPVL